MAIATGLTAERMLEIEAACIVDSRREGDNLILIAFDGSEINLGNIRGNAGSSAYAIAVDNGYSGTVAQWLTSLKGEDGDDGDDGDDGASAYQVAVANGFSGSQSAWLASLKGDPGTPADNDFILTMEPDAADLNTYLTGGAFAFNDTATNVPTASRYYVLTVRSTPKHVAQMLQMVYSPYTTWTRRYAISASAWSPWRALDPAEIKGYMIKTSTGYNSGGSNYPNGTWTQITGFDASPIATGVTVSNTNGMFTILETGDYDIEFYQRWSDVGSSARFRAGAIVKGTSAPATDASNVIATRGVESSGFLQQATTRNNVGLVSGDNITFWIRGSTTSAEFNATNSAIPGWTYASIARH